MIKLNSDFTDFYDGLCSLDNGILYNRIRNTDRSRAEDLMILKSNGIKTVKFGTIHKIGRTPSNKLVVYTNPSQHDFMGKHIYSINDVICNYSNNIVSEFIENYCGYTAKYLQIGKRRFRLMFFNKKYKDELVEGDLVAVEKLPEQYNYSFGLPIYSIDYISNGLEMLAVDFNTVQCLSSIGMDKIIKAEDVVKEIEMALLAYNKA